MDFYIYFVTSLSMFKSLKVLRVSDGKEVDLSDTIMQKLAKNNDKLLLILGTYAADFNAIEYGQRLRHYLPKLKHKGINNFIMVLNASPTAITTFAEQIDLQPEVQLYSDSLGLAGKAYNVSRGWKPEDKDMNPYVKLFGMLWGLGAWATLPSVISGYIGNPWEKQPWIEDSVAYGQSVGRWPNNALDIETSNNQIKVVKNKFSEIPLVGEWGVRPLELATLRLQNMIGISINNWDALKPTDEELKAGVLTQLGACLVLEKGNDESINLKYQWKDEGICHVANFETILQKL
jgi:hypothetical protein